MTLGHNGGPPLERGPGAARGGACWRRRIAAPGRRRREIASAGSLAPRPRHELPDTRSRSWSAAYRAGWRARGPICWHGKALGAAAGPGDALGSGVADGAARWCAGGGARRGGRAAEGRPAERAAGPLPRRQDHDGAGDGAARAGGGCSRSRRAPTGGSTWPRVARPIARTATWPARWPGRRSCAPMPICRRSWPSCRRRWGRRGDVRSRPARAAEGTTFECSCYTDPLALEHLTGSLAACITPFRRVGRAGAAAVHDQVRRGGAAARVAARAAARASGSRSMRRGGAARGRRAADGGAAGGAAARWRRRATASA